MSEPRTRLALEPLELRENPATLSTETFDTLAPPALPAGWTTWSSDGTAAFISAAGKGLNGSGGLVANAGSRTAAFAAAPQAVSADTGVTASFFADSLVPMYAFARGNNLDNPNQQSYIAAVVTRGLKVQLVEVNGSSTRVLGTVQSPASSYFSSNWVRVSLVPTGGTVKVEVTRTDNGQYLNVNGTWQTAQTAVITATTTITSTEGKVGVGRTAQYAGPVAIDNFSLIEPESDTVKQSFDTTPVGSLPNNWSSWTSNTTGAFAVSSNRSLSPANGLASNGASSSIARAWSNTDLPPNVDVSAAVFLDSLIPVQVIARGTNLQSSLASYYAVNITRGLEAKLVKVVNGVEATLATIKSSSYLSGQWVRVRLIADGAQLRVQIYRTDLRQWLSPDGKWSDSPDFVLEARDTSITGGGKAGVGRKAGAAGIATVDDFEAKPVGLASGPQVNVERVNGTGDVKGEVTFRATVTGSFNRIEFRINNVLRAVSATSPATYTFDSTTVLNGTYILTVRAFDSAGNVTTKDFAFTVANPNMDPLPDPTIPRHYTHIRIAQLAYHGTPINNSFEQNLLKNSIDLVIPNAEYLNDIQGTSPNTPQLIYSNVSNLYQGLLTDWLAYADRNGISRELAFYHVTKATGFTGTSASAQPVKWFWGVYQSKGSSAQTDVTSAARAGRNFNVQFGEAGTTTSVGYIEKFREMNVTLARGASSNWSGVWEYATAVDANGNPTAWKTLTLKQDGTNGLRNSGQITFDPPSDWVTASMIAGGDRLHYVRFRVTGGTAAAGAELFSIFGRDYVNTVGDGGTIPAFDYAADTNHDGYLNDNEYVTRQAGLDARFVYETRLFYPYYGQMRFVTNPSSSAVRHWAADYHTRLMEANPLADGVFMDNATGNLPFPGISVMEPTATFSEDSGALMNAVSRAIAPKWILANTAGGANTADPIVTGSAGAFEEFLIRPMSANWSEVNDAADLVSRRLNTPGSPLVVIDSSPLGGSRFDSRTQMATLTYYYLIGDPDRTFLMFFGGDAPSSSWTEHWSPAVNVDVGKPTGEMKEFATGTDPSNANLTYKVLSREYENALVLYKPLSYAQGKGEGTTGNNTATTHQLNGRYRIVNSNGTLGAFVTSVTLRNGEGVILLKA